jgi:hypothetical protein
MFGILSCQNPAQVKMGNLPLSERFKTKPEYGPERSIIIACQSDVMIGRQLPTLCTKNCGDLTVESLEYGMLG